MVSDEEPHGRVANRAGGGFQHHARARLSPGLDDETAGRLAPIEAIELGSSPLVTSGRRDQLMTTADLFKCGLRDRGEKG